MARELESGLDVVRKGVMGGGKGERAWGKKEKATLNGVSKDREKTIEQGRAAPKEGFLPLRS